MKKVVEQNKIQLACYTSDALSFRKTEDGYVLANSLKFIPFELKYNEQEMSVLLQLLVMNGNSLKITIEKD